MKRFITSLLICCMIIGLCLPVNATEISKNTDKQITNSTATDSSSLSTTGTTNDLSESSTAQANETNRNSQTAVSISSVNESSDTNPIGHSSSYYNLQDLGECPDITAESAIVMDANTGAVLYGKEADSKQYPASITKVMTALLTIEHCGMSDIVTFSNSAVNGIEEGSSSAGINVGAKLTVEDTLYAMMLVSANEAAAALAEHVAGSSEAFAQMMTARAEELGCTGTNFTNPHGLPDENHYTTAHDMALILKQALKYDEFRKISSTITYTLEKSDTLTTSLELWNHAKILRDDSEYYYKYAEGAKTGYTQTALNTLVTYAKKDDVELLCVILKDYGADNSYYDSTSLYEWGFEQVKGISPLMDYNLTNALKTDKSIKQTQLDSFATLNCTFDKNYYILVKPDFDASTLTEQFLLDEDQNTGRLGYINIYSGETMIGTAPVTYDITTDAATSYLSGAGADDNLETAPVNTEALTPHKILAYMVRIVVAFILIFVIMAFIRKQQAEKRRKKRILKRKNRHNLNDRKK